jgi:superfamily II DNA or RNA helicase/SAM-dependent methyltransferase/SOS-response transcriptional repressor LexA
MIMPADNHQYYEQHAAAFFEATVAVDMRELHQRFLSLVPEGGYVLDAGCGSGRDAKAFAVKGFRVAAFDSSPALAKLASAHIGQPVQVRTFHGVDEIACYDGIWACASLLHLTTNEIPEAVSRLWEALKPGGCFYFSFKQGQGEREQNGRHFTDADEMTVSNWLADLSNLASYDFWLTKDQRPERDETWINVLALKSPARSEKLVTGGDNPFLPHLCAAIRQADEIDIAVAFTKVTGLRLLLPDLHDALSANNGALQPPRVRFLTSDYLDVTDPEALRLLMLLQAQGAQVRIFQAEKGSFHLKTYLFARFGENGSLSGTAFIGSSNISRQALQDGLEWNYRVSYPGDPGFIETRNRFEQLFRHPRTQTLSDAWIDRYEAHRAPPTQTIAPGSVEKEPPPSPTSVQEAALVALEETRRSGFKRGLVVLATGLGKTWLAAFDTEQTGGRRVLFVAHREEILNQAAETFLRIRPRARVGFFMGQVRDVEVDILCASVQTLSRAAHLERFSPQHFDYIVIDEFHHAAAATYRRVINYFAPRFLLGLTATPDRTDQSDILALCDENLVFSQDLVAGINADLLAPFHYYGIFDSEVDYQAIPWRNGRFDPESLSNKLATLGRFRHVLAQWRQHAQQRTLAFCASIRHAEFMAEQFVKVGIAAAAVYAGSPLSRAEALSRLTTKQLGVVFSVELFNEGVDLPEIDTVLMLRPTESKILFLQQLGRGLRRAPDKDKLVVLDFVGNHQSFLHKPQALFGIGANFKALAHFAKALEQGRFQLPKGCYVNYDLQLINFLKSLDSDGARKEYEALKQTLGRRPTLSEFYRAGTSIPAMRRQFGTWFQLMRDVGDLDAVEEAVLSQHAAFLRSLEVTAMTKSFKMVLLEALLEIDGWRTPATLQSIAERSWQVMQRRRALLADLPPELRTQPVGDTPEWLLYWRKNPVNAWVGGNLAAGATSDFVIENERLIPAFAVATADYPAFEAMVQELLNYRLAAYETRRSSSELPSNNVIPITAAKPKTRIEIPYFPNLKIACGHFKTGQADAEEYRSLGIGYGKLDSQRHFIARASGNSMNGGKQSIRDGDYLLLELISPTRAGSITGSIVAIERQDDAGDNQYLLRVVVKQADGSYLLRANNPEYADMPADDSMRTLARLKSIVDPLEFAIGHHYLREDIPPLFGTMFNPGNWNSGHVVLHDGKVHVLLVTLNKQGKAADHRYVDHWIDDHTFHWQSQNQTGPDDSRGRSLIEHTRRDIAIHLFVRETKLSNGKGAPFLYCGPVRYVSHTGSKPMSVVFDVPEMT